MNLNLSMTKRFAKISCNISLFLSVSPDILRESENPTKAYNMTLGLTSRNSYGLMMRTFSLVYRKDSMISHLKDFAQGLLILAGYTFCRIYLLNSPRIHFHKRTHIPNSCSMPHIHIATYFFVFHFLVIYIFFSFHDLYFLNDLRAFVSCQNKPKF